MMRNFCSILLAAVLLPSLLPSQEMTALELPDVEGKIHQPLKVAGEKKAVVLAFVSPYCPTANTLLPELSRIATDHSGQFQFYLVHSDPAIKVTDAYQQAEMSEIKFPVLLDKGQALARQMHARITPEVVVVSPNGEVLYQGRINDLYLGPTKKQRKATTQDLRDALTAIAAAKEVPLSHTDAVGCKITGIP